MYKLNYPGDPDLSVEADIGLWTGRMCVNTNGSALQKISNKEFTFNDTKGRPVRLTVEGGLTKMFYINGTAAYSEPSPATPDYIALLLPCLLVVVGGAIGGACGVLCGFLALRFARKTNSAALKVLIGAGMLIAAFVLYVILAGFVLALFSR